HALRLEHGERPYEARTPVVAGEYPPPLATRAEPAGHVATQRHHVVCLDLARDRAPAEAAHVRSHHAVSLVRQHWDLVSPGERQLGKAVAEHDQRPGALLDDVQLDPVELHLTLAHGANHTRGVKPPRRGSARTHVTARWVCARKPRATRVRRAWYEGAPRFQEAEMKLGMGVVRKALFIATFGLSGLVIKDNAKKQRAAQPAAKRARPAQAKAARTPKAQSARRAKPKSARTG